jgi:hypothetical protein
MMRRGGASPLAPPANVRMACANWFGTTISSCAASCRMSCIVRASSVA